MKHEAEIKELLINNAIHLIAEGGFEKATTKELTHSGGAIHGFKMNEVYIYRIFGSKEKLYESVFSCLDNELFNAFRKGVEIVGGFEELSKEKLYRFFTMAWNFIMGNEERCRCYVRYYYSIYFKGHSLFEHRKLFSAMISEFSSMFKEEADVLSIMHSVFIALFNFAIRVYNGELKNSDANTPHIFNVLYCMVATYLKQPVDVTR